MKANKHKGFGPKPAASKDADQAMEKFVAELASSLKTLSEVIEIPAGQGEVDALLDKPCSSNERAYKDAYDRIVVAKQLASPEEIEILNQMKPFVKELLSQ